MGHAGSRAVATAVLCAAVVAVGLSGCSHGTDGGARGCAPERPHVSADVVRPGGTVTVSVSAATCDPRFDAADRALHLVWEDAQHHRTRIATVHAQASGAFEQEVRIPSTSGTGGGQLFVSGVEVPCADTGSCAADETLLTVVATAPHIDASGRANQIAAELARRLQPTIGHRPSFVELAIVPDGLEVWLSRPATSSFDAESAFAQRAFAAAQTSTPPTERDIAAQARLHVTFIQHSRSTLHTLSDRILRDRPWWTSQGLDLVRWQVDTGTDSVRIFLSRYSDDAARTLIDRYGGAITVSPKDTGAAVAL